MACALPFPLRSRNIPGREECAEQVSAGKRLPQEKSLLRNMPLHRRPQRKNLHRPLTSCRSARNARQRRKKQRNTGGGNLALPGEQKNFQRLAHGTGKKLAMEKEADQMRRIAHDTGKKKRPAPVSHGRSEEDFPSFCVTSQAGESAEVRRNAPEETFKSRKNSHAENTAGRIFRQKISPRRKAPRTRQEKNNSHRGAVPALLFAASLSARACASTTESQRPPAGTPTEALRPGPGTRKADTALPPQRNMFRPAPSAVHVPSSHGKTPSPIPRREGCGIFSLPEGREQKKALQEDEVRLKAAGL